MLLTVVAPLVAFAVLTAGNAFFVAAEFSLVTVDRAAIDHHAEEGDPVAGRIRAALSELSFQLSAAQLGITITALLTGYLAEPALAKLFAPLLRRLGSAGDPVGYALALALATLISMLFGELVPKNAALARPMPIARRTVAPMRLFSSALAWLIRLLNGSANALVRRLGVQPQEELASARSPEELGLLAVYSARAGALPPETALLLRRTIRFGEKRAAEAMTPRVRVIGVAADASVQSVLELIQSTGKSRFPVYEQSLDEVVGVISVIDALAVPVGRRQQTPARRVAREPVAVPGSLDLDRVLAALRLAGADMAVVIDEYGGTDGVVTIEDLVEELVGEIVDEYDVDVAAFVEGSVLAPPTGAQGLVEGVLRADELEEATGFRMPDGPYETLAGFLLARLGHIPNPGEQISEDGWEFTVVEVHRHRIQQVSVVGPASPGDGAEVAR